MTLIYDVVSLSPTDNDRYVRTAPENPKKVCQIIEHPIGELISIYFKTLFHYDGLYSLTLYKSLF